ncbi:ABC transporter permease [Gryllotalpicola protaetiae]|uniref:ABC transporter permease n=1 Tax=Gryllotalpicola protaetiae TaxID=2419771 RepID=UPI001FEA6F1E|nr:ABC transporter permease [Gryllotalpicola protaetiae]
MTTATAPTQSNALAGLSGIRLSFPRLVRSEWIKLRSIRSTVWCFAILFVLNIGFPILIASVGNFGGATNPHLSGDSAGTIAVTVTTLGVNFTSLVVAVLGVLIISGEYATGMVRGTFTADPRRTGAFLAKALVLAIATFVVSAASTWIAALAIHPILANKNIDFSLGDSKIFLPILGSSVYAVLIALLAFGIGSLVRATAAGVAITLGVLLVAPLILNILTALLSGTHWPADVNTFLPASAGSQLFAYASDTSAAATNGPAAAQGGATASTITLNGWQGFGILGGEVLAVGIAAYILLKRRDA